MKGVSADADPHYQKLYGRVTDVCSNRRGQPNRCAMREPRPGRNPSVIRFASPSGKYALPIVYRSYRLQQVKEHLWFYSFRYSVYGQPSKNKANLSMHCLTCTTMCFSPAGQFSLNLKKFQTIAAIAPTLSTQLSFSSAGIATGLSSRNFRLAGHSDSFISPSEFFISPNSHWLILEKFQTGRPFRQLYKPG